jgi:superfamily II DNA or RNA helicase
LYRIGLSGTIPIGTDVGYYNLIGLFGEFTEYLTYQEAFDRGYISPMKLNVKLLTYPAEDCKHIFDNKKDYRYELEFVQKHKLRNLYLMRLMKSFDRNTLMLFTNIESHGRVLHEYLKEHLRHKTIFYIDGSTKVEDREDIRRAMESQNDVILLASYGTFSAGINVKNIHNVVFASAYRSEVKTFQSIGRGLRTLEDKNLQVYDIVDVLSYREGRNSYNNYLIDQYADRQSQYKERDFIIEKETIVL